MSKNPSKVTHGATAVVVNDDTIQLQLLTELLLEQGLAVRAFL